MITDIDELDLSKKYTYADYLSWRLKERVELIMGRVFRMSPAPKADHQQISSTVSGEFYQFLKGKKCKVFSAPFDVRLVSNDEKEDNQIETIVQPDICVICDLNKIDDRGCLGAPELIVEIISRSSVKKDLHEKYELYESSGVQEYWVVQPNDKTLIIYRLGADDKYFSSKLLTMGDIAESKVIEGFKLDLNDVFQDIVNEPREEYGAGQIRLDP